MKFTDIFIRRPVLSIVVSLLILILGIQAGNNLTVRQYPRSDISVIIINTVYVGANAELVRGFITTPIESDRIRWWYRLYRITKCYGYVHSDGAFAPEL